MQCKPLFDDHYTTITGPLGGLGWEEDGAFDYEDADDDDDDDGNDDDDDSDDDDEEPKKSDKERGLEKAAATERKKRQAVQAELDALKAEKAERERKAEEAKGEYEGLYGKEKTRADELEGKLTKLQERETARLERVAATNDTLLSELPDEFKDLVPEGLDADATSSQLRRLAKLANKSDDRPRGTRTGGGKKGSIKYPAASKAYAEKHEMSPEDGHRSWLRSRAGKEWSARNDS